MPWPKRAKPYSLEMPASDLDPHLLCRADLSGIRELILTGVTFVESPFGGNSLSELRYFPSLRTLIIRELWYTTGTSSCVDEDFVKVLPRGLVDLEISTRDHETFPNFLPALRRHTTAVEGEESSLTHLALSGLRLASWDGLADLPLRQLFLSPHRDDDPRAIFAELVKCKGLHNLRLENMPLLDAQARELALASRLTLKTLCVHHVPHLQPNACHLLTSHLDPRAQVCVSRGDEHAWVDYRPTILSRTAERKQALLRQRREQAEREQALYQGVDEMIQ